MKRSRNRKIINLEVEEDSELSELRSELYLLFLENWREIQHTYGQISELGELNELVNVKDIPNIDLLVGRELELWRGIIALSIFFEKKAGSKTKFTSSLSSLSSLILKLAAEDAKQRQTENTTETGEVILTQILLSVVKEDNYYPVKTLKEKMLEAFDEEQKWITTRWIGNALRRLGFKEKRRVGTGYQYRICKADVEDLAARLGVATLEKTELQKLEEVKKWILESKKDGVISASALNGKIKESGFDPQKIVQKLEAEGFLFGVTELNAWGVT